MPTRRQTTIGLLSAAVGSAAVTSGSFLSETTSTADLRVVVVSELSLKPGPNEEYVTTNDAGEVESIEIRHLNQRASTWFEGLIEIANEGDVAYDRLAFEFTPAGEADESDEAVAETLQVISGDEPTGTDEQGRTTLLAAADKSLGPGDAVEFGVTVNLVASSSPGDLDDLPDASDVALEITAIRE